jgi:D-arabinose 1-dehydrogenase-like Zn-dependent alcohol dehydrogenase
MRAMGVVAYGEPLRQLDLEAPELPPGHARLEVLTCGVCFSDVKTARGRMPYSGRLSLPHVPGHEICARVAETNPPGAFEPGAMVVVYHLWPCRRCSRCRAGEDNLCLAPQAWTGFTHPGGFQEELVVPIDRLVPVPAGIDPVHAAPLTCALGTAYRAVVTRGRVIAGSSVVVVGLGGVGMHALQIAATAGGRVVGIDRSERAVAVAEELGLTALYGDGDDTERRLLHVFGGDGVDAVVDTVGTVETLRQAERLVRPGGRIVAVGYALDGIIELPAAPVVLQEKELLGSRYVRMDELERAISLVAEGRVRTVIDRVEPLAEANRGLEALEAGEVVGRVVLDVAGVT